MKKSNVKIFASEDYNMRFNKTTGVLIRYGKNLEDDPYMCEHGPEILDIEISAGGDCMGNCPFCYKANGGGQPHTHNMSLIEFKHILSTFNLNVLTQMALGIMDIGTNPEFFEMMEHARSEGIIPNYTTHGLDMTPEYAAKSAELCGVVAVSVVDKAKTFSAVKMLMSAGLSQVNIHYMLSEETYENASILMDEIAVDPELKNLHALVFLQYKAKGRGTGDYTTIQDAEKYKVLLAKGQKLHIPIGFDSCSAPMYMKAIEALPNAEELLKFVEPCESGLFSSYINCSGVFYPCSFMEDQPGWESGIGVLECEDFTESVWKHERTYLWRERLMNAKPEACASCKLAAGCRVCPEYKELRCKEVS